MFRGKRPRCQRDAKGMLSQEEQLKELELFCQRRADSWVNSHNYKYLRVCHADEELNVFCRPLGKAQNNGGKVRDRVQLGWEPCEEQRCVEPVRLQCKGMNTTLRRDTSGAPVVFLFCLPVCSTRQQSYTIPSLASPEPTPSAAELQMNCFTG